MSKSESGSKVEVADTKARERLQLSHNIKPASIAAYVIIIIIIISLN